VCKRERDGVRKEGVRERKRVYEITEQSFHSEVHSSSSIIINLFF